MNILSQDDFVGRPTCVSRSRWPYLLIILGILLLSRPTEAGGFDTALRLYNQGKYQRAGQHWKQAGKSAEDSGASFYNVAELYKHGLGYKQHYGRAAGWYRQAVDKGYVPAMVALAVLHAREGGAAMRSTSASILWWEKAARLGDRVSMLELARLYLNDVEHKNLLLAKAYAKRAAITGIQTAGGLNAVDLLAKIDQAFSLIDLGGSRQVHALAADLITLEMATHYSFTSALQYVVANRLIGAKIHRTAYNQYAVTLGEFIGAEDAYQFVNKLPEYLQRDLPKPRSVAVLQSELLKPVVNLLDAWVSQQHSSAFTVELYRADVDLDSEDFIDHFQLSNAAVYRSSLGESVVIAGVFKNAAEAQSVMQRLPKTLLKFQPSVRSYAAIQAEQQQQLITQTSTLERTLPVKQAVTEVASVLPFYNSLSGANTNKRSNTAWRTQKPSTTRNSTKTRSPR